MTDVRYLSKRFILEFIELYKTLPSLWNLKSKLYYNRTQKNADYEIMIKKLREVEPEATREMVTKKINSMRSSRRKETIKVEQAIEAGEMYVPKLWYYKALDFVDGEETTQAVGEQEQKFSETYSFKESRDSQTNISTSSTTIVPERRLSISFTNDSLSNQAPSEPDNAPVVAFTTQLNSPQPQTEKRKRKLTREETKDTHEAFGRYIAHKLEILEHTQRIFAEKIINEAIFEAELGNLSRDCYVFVPARKRKTSDSSDSKSE